MSDPENCPINPTSEDLYPTFNDYSNPANFNIIPGIYNPYGDNPNFFNPPNYSHPLVYNFNPMHTEQAFPQSHVYTSNEDLSPSQPTFSTRPRLHNIHPNQRICLSCRFFFFLLIIQLVFIIVTLNVEWFSYCYWDFSLTNRVGSFKHGDYKDGSIKSLYDDACDSNKDKFKACPDLCDSIKNVRYSGEKLIFIGVAACVLTVISFLLGIIKYSCKSSKIISWIIFLSAFGSALVNTIGVITYKSESKFSNNFHKVDKSQDFLNDYPDNFTWKAAYYLSIITLIIQWFTTIFSKIFISRMSRI